MVRAVFLHIPKTAGTSLRETLCRGLGEDAVSPAFGASEMTEAEADALRCYSVVFGHISVTDARRFFPDAMLLTAVRDPVERCLSWYRFVRSVGVPPYPDVMAALSHDIDDFFSLDVETVFRNIYNRQVRQLGDHVLNTGVDMQDAFERAKATLDECVWIGRQEAMQEDLARLADILPQMAGVNLSRLNVTAGGHAGRPIPDELRRKIARYNAFDEALYADVVRRCGG